METILAQLDFILKKEVTLHEGFSKLLLAQREAILNRKPQDLIEICARLDAKASQALSLKKERQVVIDNFLSIYALEPASTFQKTLETATDPAFDDLKIQVQSLFGLIQKCQRFVMQNRMMATRFLSVIQGIFQIIAPSKSIPQYNNKGTLRVSMGSSSSQLETLA